MSPVPVTAQTLLDGTVTTGSSHLVARSPSHPARDADDRLPPRLVTTFRSGVVAIGGSILVAWAVPLVVLALGSPIVLLVRTVLEIFRWL
jgi:hypothetical protein